MKKIVIVEDKGAFRTHLAEVVASLEDRCALYCFSNGEDTLAFLKASSEPIDLALVDLGLPGIQGADVISAVRAAHPSTPILVVSIFSDEGKVVEAIRCGATGYLVKGDTDNARQGIKQALEGQFPISPTVARYLFSIAQGKDPKAQACGSAGKYKGPKLSRQEYRLLTFIAEGMSYCEAARQMGITLHTVQSYSRNLFRKLDVHSRTQALARARAEGLLQ